MPPLERTHLFKGAFVKCLAFKGGVYLRGRLKIGEHLFEALQYLKGGQILKFSQLKYQPHIFFVCGEVFLYFCILWWSGLVG